MQFQIVDKKLKDIKADIELIFVVDKDLKHKFISDKEAIKFNNYKGESVLILSESKRAYVPLSKLDLDELRVAAAKAYNALKSLNIKSIKLASYVAQCQKLGFEALAEGFLLGSYEFNKYKEKKEKYTLKEIIFSTEEFAGKKVDLKAANEGFKEAEIIASATNFTKDIVNEIPEIYTPQKMAEDAQNLAKSHASIKCEVYDEKFLAKENMNAFLAVNRASVHKPRLIHLTYKPKKSKKRIIFVGKGLTYDSGGLSLKPADYMLTMKSDKSGAAAALGIIKGAAELNLPFEIHAILGATENMIGGNAYKPDDVLISRSGVSIEVRNTDAEGRLVLADCLSYAQDFKPDILIDMATLTGACVVGLGEYTTGIMGNSESLKSEFKSKIKDSGELATTLDFNPYLSELIKSQIADVSNCASSRYGGAITAGMFLAKFIRDEYKDKWLHLDIAGPAYREKAWGYNQAGASGAGVRMNLYFLQALSKEN
ncbi:leucyl aminopeptidase [Campylobacter concisus]|uniref:Probable cytosol aminopeptidase n=1 Tax=Campylobacter concisus TaxID=199 RepID=A0A7S9S6H9_9BACT|nr:leucyl aminopeptidase [Campylobacter concisus]QPH97321.1 leucyl aminopeptidase [Campylobacter concisus]QPI04519.1 leucyl aminopeptidase [Campylobacter concisus]